MTMFTFHTNLSISKIDTTYLALIHVPSYNHSRHILCSFCSTSAPSLDWLIFLSLYHPSFFPWIYNPNRIEIRVFIFGTTFLKWAQSIIGIGYILPTIWGYMSIGGYLCAIRAQGCGMCSFLKRILDRVAECKIIYTEKKLLPPLKLPHFSH